LKDETRVWLTYAEENLKAAEVLGDLHLFNPCLQNVQQSIEKGLKALLFEKANAQRKTHSIGELVQLLASHKVDILLSDDDCDLLDSIYLPSKYPLAGVLPDFEPDDELCKLCLSLAQTVLEQIDQMLAG
jgi:HEPN domain-containing protein